MTHDHYHALINEPNRRRTRKLLNMDRALSDETGMTTNGTLQSQETQQHLGAENTQ